MRRAVLLASPLLVLGCATSADPRNDHYDYYNPFKAGGHIEFEIERGVYRIEAKGERTRGDPYTSVRTLWARRARDLCGGGTYREFAIDETAYGSRPDPFDRLIAVRTGYAVCDSASLSLEQARAITRSKGWPL